MILNWDNIRQVLTASDRTLLYGPPSTGKTHAAVTIRDDKSPVYSITCHEGTAADEVRGHFLPTGGGNFRWHDGPGVRAWREGAVLVINEIDRASDEVRTLLYALADDPSFARLTLPTGETVRPSSGFKIVATMNGTPDVFTEALRSRFPVSIYIDEPAPEAIASLSADLQGPARGSCVLADNPITLRSWLAFDKLRATVDETVAAFAVFGDRGAEILDTLRLAAAK